MEDYAPILWLLFIVVSMGFSALSKARKRAARRADETEEGQERNAGQGHPTVPRYPTPGSGLPEGFPLPQQRSRRRPLRPRPEAQIHYATDRCTTGDRTTGRCVAVADAGNSIFPTRTAARGRKPPTQAQQRIGRPAAGYGGNARKGARTVAGNGGDGQ